MIGVFFSMLSTFWRMSMLWKSFVPMLFVQFSFHNCASSDANPNKNQTWLQFRRLESCRFWAANVFFASPLHLPLLLIKALAFTKQMAWRTVFLLFCVWCWRSFALETNAPIQTKHVQPFSMCNIWLSSMEIGRCEESRLIMSDSLHLMKWDFRLNSFACKLLR